MSTIDEKRNELSVRTQPAGGPVGPAVEEKTVPSPQGRRRLILLVHGYNNSETVARAAYSKFVKRIGDAPGGFAGPIFKFFWPGDAGSNPLVSALSYPWEIHPAIDSARLLAEYVRNLSGPQGTLVDVDLVGHSLGCRLVLELIEDLIASPPLRARIRTVCLMAAAVPVRRVEEGAELHRAAIGPENRLVLYSRSDTVLHFAFPVGEMAAGEGFLPHAVGRFGDPAECWTAKSEMPSYAHGDYWGGSDSYRSVATLLGFLTSRSIPETAMPSRLLSETGAPSNRELDSRELPLRFVGGES